MLKLLKVLHTLAWAIVVACILYVLYAAITDNIGPLLWLCLGIVLGEGLILIANGWRCPITKIAEKHTNEITDNFDIYLPKWLARNNKTIFTIVFTIAVIILIYRLLS